MLSTNWCYRCGGRFSGSDGHICQGAWVTGSPGWEPGKIEFYPYQLTEETIRRIVREELKRAADEAKGSTP